MKYEILIKFKGVPKLRITEDSLLVQLEKDGNFIRCYVYDDVHIEVKTEKDNGIN